MLIDVATNRLTNDKSEWLTSKKCQLLDCYCLQGVSKIGFSTDRLSNRYFYLPGYVSGTEWLKNNNTKILGAI